MKFSISGADRQTGDDVTVTVAATTIAEAREKASNMGLLVSKIEATDEALAPVLQHPLRAAPPSPPVQQGAWMQPHPAQGYAPTINVNMPRRGNSLGLVSLIIGILAFLFCWVPIVSVIAFILAMFGLLLGGVGFIVSLTRGGSSIGLPIGGLAICFVAALISFIMGVAPIMAIGGAAAEAAQRAATQPAATRPSWKP